MKYIYILALLLSFTTMANAQFGIKGGLVNSTFNTGYDDGDTPAITNREANQGFTLGVVYSHCLGCDFSLQPELSYTQKGQSYTTSDGRDVDVKLAYIDMPLNIRWKIYKPVYIYAGPMFSFGVNKSYKYTLNNVEESDKTLDDAYKSFEWGVNAGLGLQYDRYFIDARVTRGMISQDRAVEYNSLTLPKYGFRNFTLQFTAGAYF